jgi:glycosyltransferase involved in cell wall biosynthesis
MPDYQPLDAVPRIAAKSQIFPPGVDVLPPRGSRPTGPLRILWAARWEHDKNPEEFFEALEILKQRGVAFRLSVIGEQFRDVPAVFARAREQFREEIDRWGHQPTRSRYEAALREADVFVSTAHHEFFGLSAVEAALAGAWPVLPRRLAYPEVFGTENGGLFYEGGAEGLAARLARLADRVASDPEGSASRDRALQKLRERLRCFEWPHLTSRLDTAAETVRERHQP